MDGSELHRDMDKRTVERRGPVKLTTDKQARKERPVARGVMDYFPLALAEVANVSFIGNQQHNPGEEMHWAKDKSTDHADCLARHLMERGTFDNDGLRHSAKAAWRALALLQIELESPKQPTFQGVTIKHCPDLSAMADIDPSGRVYVQRDAGMDAVIGGFEEKEARILRQRNIDRGRFVELGCSDEVARNIVGGITYANWIDPGEMPYIYVAGPMRGYKHFNFPAFDKVRDEWVARGVNVISPADIDRAAGDAQSNNQTTFVHRDFFAIYFLKKQANPNNAVVFLHNWEKSTGAFGEFGLARWLGLQLVGERGPMRNMSFVKMTDALMDTLVKQ